MSSPLLPSVLFLLTGAAVMAKDLPSQEPGAVPGADLAGLRAAFLQRHSGKRSEGAADKVSRQAAAVSTGQVEQTYLKASNTGAADYFGSVAISGNTAIVGAPFEDSNATGIGGSGTNNKAQNSGAAYIFVKIDGKWSQQAYLKSSDSKASDEFGFAVGISGNSVVIGAFAKATSTVTGTGTTAVTKTNPYQGAAYVFTRSGTTWSQEATLLAAQPDGYDAFGYSVAISDNTVVVGAIGESSTATRVNGNQTNNALTQSGAAYVFSRTGIEWTQQAYLKAIKPGKLDHFGMAVAISGETVAVGAPDRADSKGAVYTYARTGTIWGDIKILQARNADPGDRFGRALALSGTSLLVGAPGEASAATTVGGNPKNNKAPGAGAAYLYSRNTAIWGLPVYLKSSRNSRGDAFGSAVAVREGVAMVGAPGEDNGGKNSGAAYLFALNDNQWSESRILQASDRDNNDRLGRSIALDGSTGICGADGEASNAKGVDGDKFNNKAKNAGAAYVFEQLGPVIALEQGTVSLPNGMTSLDLGTTGLGLTTISVVSLRNLGITPLTNLKFTVTGTDALSFSVDSSVTAASLPPGSSTALGIVFSPTGTLLGTRTANLDCTSSDPTVTSFSIKLTGKVAN